MATYNHLRLDHRLWFPAIELIIIVIYGCQHNLKFWQRKLFDIFIKWIIQTLDLRAHVPFTLKADFRFFYLLQKIRWNFYRSSWHFTVPRKTAMTKTRELNAKDWNFSFSFLMLYNKHFELFVAIGDYVNCLSVWHGR